VPLKLTWHFQAADERIIMIWGLAARPLRQVNLRVFEYERR
jgi:hypothetical protein